MMRILIISLASTFVIIVPLHAEQLNPLGKPEFKPGTIAAYYIWVDRDGLHLRTTTKSQQHVFSGKITANKRISKVRAVLPDKRKDVRDIGTLSDSQKELKFRFKTDGGLDGFTVNFENPRQGRPLVIEFDLKIDGENGKIVTQRIFIGKQKSNPDRASFKLKIQRQ